MKKDLTFLFIFLLTITSITTFAQTKNKAVYTEYKNEFYEQMKKDIDAFNKEKTPEKLSFKVDFSKLDLPKSKDEFEYHWHIEPISQGMTGTCWCFSSTSFFESEIFRLSNRKIDLSELHTVYYEYIEKAKRFVKERGNSEFGEGSEANATRRIWQQYGVVPAENYTGLKEGQKFHDHRKMYEEMYRYLQSLKSNNNWNEVEAVSTIKSILNHYIGVPPKEIKVDGKTMTPKQYFTDVVKLNMEDYVDVISLMQKPYYTQIEYNVPDNWWLDDTYYNIPLDEYMDVINKALKNGYTIAFGGDVSEPGLDANYEVAVIPTFDIPSEYIDENARQFRFNNKTTTDDHGIHAVGITEKDGKKWYLIKDSGAGARNGNNIGYYFYNEDFVKLKMVDIMIHKDAVKDVLKKFNK